MGEVREVLFGMRERASLQNDLELRPLVAFHQGSMKVKTLEW
jgi:hypothetical protein